MVQDGARFKERRLSLKKSRPRLKEWSKVKKKSCSIFLCFPRFCWRLLWTAWARRRGLEIAWDLAISKLHAISIPSLAKRCIVTCHLSHFRGQRHLVSCQCSLDWGCLFVDWEEWHCSVEIHVKPTKSTYSTSSSTWKFVKRVEHNARAAHRVERTECICLSGQAEKIKEIKWYQVHIKIYQEIWRPTAILYVWS